VQNVFAHFARFFFARFAARFGLDLLGLQFGFALDDRRGDGFGFDLQFGNELAAHRLYQGTMCDAPRLGPAH
jgi:hypothetical protein